MATPEPPNRAPIIAATLYSIDTLTSSLSAKAMLKNQPMRKAIINNTIVMVKMFLIIPFICF
jgi:hypothetical protein